MSGFMIVTIISFSLYCSIVKNIHLDEKITSPLKFYCKYIYGITGTISLIPIATQNYVG